MPLIPRRLRRQPTPTRQQTGTTYASQPAQGVKPPSYDELGSSKAATLIDPVPDLGNPAQQRRTYTKMVRDDATVRMSLRGGKAPVLGAEWFIQPYSADPQDQIIQEFVEFNIFNGMTTPWIKTLEQILKMYEADKSVFEPVWELREWAPRKSATGANRRNYTMLKKLAFRPPSTIGQVTYDDNGGPVSIQHTKIDASGGSQEVDLPIEKLIIFTFDQQDGTIDGMSILRSAYKHWWYKNHLYNIDAIQKERHGVGVPDIEVQPGASDADKKLAHELGRNLRTNEKAYIVRSPNLKVGFADLGSHQVVDVLASIEHHDQMIMKNIMLSFLDTKGSSGRAASATGMDMFLKSMRHVASSICDAINMYLIPNLVAYNFPTDKFPKLSVRGVGEVKDLQMWAAAMRNLIDVDAISLDEPTEQWIRQQTDMPRLTTEWQPPSKRPTRVQEVFQAKTGVTVEGDTSSGNTSNNGGAGNVGKSPSSAAT